jgi:hypothetical protein
VATPALDPACLDPRRKQPHPTHTRSCLGVAPAELQVVGPRLVRQGGEGQLSRLHMQQWFPAEGLWPVKSDPNGPSPFLNLRCPAPQLAGHPAMNRLTKHQPRPAPRNVTSRPETQPVSTITCHSRVNHHPARGTPTPSRTAGSGSKLIKSAGSAGARPVGGASRRPPPAAADASI